MFATEVIKGDSGGGYGGGGTQTGKIKEKHPVRWRAIQPLQ